MPSVISLFLAAAAGFTFVAPIQDSYPSLSPDGSTLAFHSTRSGRVALYLADADGSHVRTLLDSGDGPITPAWSPDGRTIAFVARVNKQFEIFVIDRDGGNRRRITNSAGDDMHPHFGADGRIYFNSARKSENATADWSDIFSMNSDGSHVRQLTHCRAVCTFAAPSPDGRWLAFRKELQEPGVDWDQKASATNSEIMVMKLAGGGERNVSAHPAFDGWPSWSPNSQWIAFASSRDSTPFVGQVYLIQPDGTRLRRITAGPLSNAQPSFTPDGTAILTYTLHETDVTQIGGIGRWPVDAL